MKRQIGKDGPQTPAFFAESAESIENKRVRFCVVAKKRKRVCKNMKRKELNAGKSLWRGFLREEDERETGPLRSAFRANWKLSGKTKKGGPS